MNLDDMQVTDNTNEMFADLGIFRKLIFKCVTFFVWWFDKLVYKKHNLSVNLLIFNIEGSEGDLTEEEAKTYETYQITETKH